MIDICLDTRECLCLCINDKDFAKGKVTYKILKWSHPSDHDSQPLVEISNKYDDDVKQGEAWEDDEVLQYHYQEDMDCVTTDRPNKNQHHVQQKITTSKDSRKNIPILCFL